MSEVRRSFGFPLSVAVVSDVGRVRTNNEDAHGHAWLEDGTLWVIVADGMGGHDAGEVASGLAVRVVEDGVSRDLAADPRERLYHALLEANQAILDEGGRSGTTGMGTTAITAIIQGAYAHVGLIGDSRCYHVRRGHALWRTLDHTRVQLLLDNGEITEEDARNHPEAGMLTRALGHGKMADGRPLVPDVLADPLFMEEGDALVLSSDGLHDLVEDWEIAQAVAGRTSEAAAEALVDLACERGGHDNVTVAVVTAGPRAATFDESYVPETYAAEQGPPPTEEAAETTYPGHEAEQGGQIPVVSGPVAYAGGMPVAMATEAPKSSKRGLMVGAAVLVLVGGLAVALVLGLVALAFGMGWV